MGVAVERSLGVTILRLVAGEVPDNQGLVTAGGQEHVGASRTGQLLRMLASSMARLTYFSIEVARLVTQPFCKETVS